VLWPKAVINVLTIASTKLTAIWVGGSRLVVVGRDSGTERCSGDQRLPGSDHILYDHTYLHFMHTNLIMHLYFNIGGPYCCESKDKIVQL